MGKPDEADKIKIENQDWLHCSTSEQSVRQIDEFIVVSSWKG